MVGGTGFVGTALRDLFDKTGEDSVTFTTSGLNSNSRRSFKSVNYEVVTWNILNECELDPNFDLVFHAATPASALLNSSDPDQMLNIIVTGMENLIKFLSGHRNQPTVLFTSSGAIYGSDTSLVENIKEDSPVMLDLHDQGSAYATGKRKAEAMLAQATESGICLGIIARLFAFSGSHLPRDRHFAIGNFVDDAVQKEKIVIRSNGSSIRSYLDERDLANWLLAIAQRGVPDRVYHVGSERAITIRDLALLVSKRYELMTGIVSPVKILGQTSSLDGISRYVPSTFQTRKELKLSETISLEDSIDSMLQSAISESF